MFNDLEQLRNWIWHQPANLTVRRWRLRKFDKMRYAEDYEGIWEMVKIMKGEY